MLDVFDTFTLCLGLITVKKVYVGPRWVFEGIPFQRR